jgi:hypothetical protein
MAVKIRIELNTAGIGALARSDELRADMRARAERVAAQAGTRAPATSEPIAFEVVDRTGKRARARVIASHAGVMRLEAKYRFLAGSLDVAGG